MKIANKISLSFFITNLILIVVAGSIFYMVASNNLEKTIFQQLVIAAESRAHHVETYLEAIPVNESKNNISNYSF